MTRNSRQIWTLRLSLLLAIAISSKASTDRWQSVITRVPPAVFHKLPGPIAAYLERRGCTIPQTYLVSVVPENVIRGEFMGPGTHDWAILCSRGGTSAILVFAENTATPAAELASRPDSEFMQSIDTSGQLRFSRLIEPISRHELLRGLAKGDPKIDHDGIEDSFLEKASVVHLRIGQHWRELSGSD